MKVADPNVVRARLRDYASRPEPQEIDKSVRGAVIGEINKALRIYLTDEKKEIDSDRRWIFGWIFGSDDEPFREMHTKELTPQMVNGLKRWIGAKLMGSEWLPRIAWKDELYWVRGRISTYHRLQRGGQEISLGELTKKYLAWLPEDSGEGMVRFVETEEGSMVEAVLKIGGEPVAVSDTEFPPIGEVIQVKAKSVYDGNIYRGDEL
ncbi:MAG: hypothetical protein ABIG63_16505 [Chloroflexota bacterium]